MILEGIVTSQSTIGVLNIAPMGPIVDESLETMHLRPYQTSTTYRNLKETGCGVFHVTDDVLLLAQAAIGQLDPIPETVPAERIAGRILTSACRWYEFEVTSLDDREERTSIMTQVVHVGRLRDFLGFNRARHAVVEAAILATRVHLLGKQNVLDEFVRLASPVEKTAGPREQRAFELLRAYVTRTLHGG